MKSSRLVLGLVALALGACGADGSDGGSAGHAGSSGAGGSSGGTSGTGYPDCRYDGVSLGSAETRTIVSVDDPDDLLDSGNWDNLALDRTHVYWTAETYDGVDYVSDVYRMPREGGAQEHITSFDDQNQLADLVVDSDGFVYIRTGAKVLRAPVTGGPAEIVWDYVTGYYHSSETIQVDSTNVYVLHIGLSGSLYSIAKSNFAPTELAEFTWPHEIALDDQNIYVSILGEGSQGADGVYEWTPQLYRLPKTGGTPALLADLPVQMESLQVTSTHVYGMLIATPLYNTLVRIPIGGGSIETLDEAGCVMADQVRVAGDYLYYVPGGIMRMKTDGTEMTWAEVPDPEGLFDGLNRIEVDQGVVYQLATAGSIGRYVFR